MKGSFHINVPIYRSGNLFLTRKPNASCSLPDEEEVSKQKFDSCNA